MKFILAVSEQSKKSPPFIQLWEVVLFITIISLILVALFPEHLKEKTLASHTISEVTLSYLKAFRRKEPQNTQLDLAIIAQEIGLGYIRESKAVFARLKNSISTLTPAMAMELEWIDYLLLRDKLSKSKRNTSQRVEYLRQLREMATVLITLPLEPDKLKILASDYLQLNEAGAAYNIYNQLLENHGLTTPEEFAEGGSVAMQNNKQRESANYYWTAYEKETDIVDRRKYALNALRALWAGNMPNEALGLANTLPDAVINDRNTLLFLSDLAIAANHPDVALKFALKALLYSPKHHHE